MDADWQTLVREGRIVAAVVAYRAAAGVGLAEAKEAVEWWQDVVLPPSVAYRQAVRIGERIADQLAEYARHTGRVVAYWVGVLPATPSDLVGRSDILHAELPEEADGLDLRVLVELPGTPPAKRREAIKAALSGGARLVWLIELDLPTVSVITDPDEYRRYYEGATFTGGDVLPGFSCKVSDLFA